MQGIKTVVIMMNDSQYLNLTWGKKYSKIRSITSQDTKSGNADLRNFTSFSMICTEELLI